MLPWLIGCEESGAVTAAFRARGIEAYSCDLEPTRGNPDWHIQGDVFDALGSRKWRGAIIFPECRYLSVSGQHWNHRTPGRPENVETAVAFARRCINAADEFDVEYVAVENPVSILSTRVRKPDQIIQPYHFGSDASKTTCLWLHRLPKLQHGLYVPPRLVCKECGARAAYLDGAKDCPACGAEAGACWRPRWANQTDSGQNRLAPSPTRSRDRAATYPGIAAAFAEQWGGL